MIGKFKGEYEWLSNFYTCLVRYEGVMYMSVEHAYQAAKCLNVEDRVKFNKSGLTAGQAKRLGQTVEILPDWNNKRLAIMESLVYYKFTKSIYLKNLLYNTHPLLLVEGNNWGDSFWGMFEGEGHNHLGEILMKVRQKLLPEVYNG